jgi:hypothetical protein
VIKRASTSSEAASDAAELCARMIGGKEFAARVLAHADTTSLTASCNSSLERRNLARLSRSVLAIIGSTSFVSRIMNGALANRFPALLYRLWCLDGTSTNMLQAYKQTHDQGTSCSDY